MLKKSRRFHGHNSLSFVHSKGRAVRSGFLQLKYAPNHKRTNSRLAVVVSKKVVKGAPKRNRIRRRIYEAMRLQWPMLAAPHDLVVLVFDERIGEMPATQLNRHVVELLHKANLYKT